ncbi:hypothetical protein EKD04_025190 [Chloroflexales bacterium ZM16-3]|nr:hypothetical protein [Chloroflexales bacterium ZM16-3]
MNLLILACSATKRADTAPLPARERYDGPAYRVLRTALRERAGLAEALTIRILSAEYGLIASDTPIPWYDRRMTPTRARELIPAVRAARRPLERQRWDAIAISLGAAYWPAMPEDWGVMTIGVEQPPETIRMISGSQGRRLGQLRQWLWAVPL